MGWENLLVTGQIEETYKIFGDEVVLRLLTDGEDIKASRAASDPMNDVITREKIMSTETLIRAIKTVNGRSFCGYMPPKTTDGEQDVREREQALKRGREIMESVQPPVKYIVLAKYLELRNLQQIEIGAKLQALGEVAESPFSATSGDSLKKLQKALEQSGLVESSISREPAL